MPTIPKVSPTSEAAIFARLWETDRGELPLVLARQLLKIGFSPADRARMHALAVKNQEGRLTPAEQEELAGYVKVGDLLALLQSKARQRLRKDGKQKNGHG